jgi:hypothetical protein
MMNILDGSIDDILTHYQRHTVGMSASIGPMLRKLAREVACYSEQHP